MIRPGFDEVTYKMALAAGTAFSATASAISGDWSLAMIGVPFSVLMAGFAGALIALWVMPPTASWWKALVIGTAFAGYGTPFVMEFFGWTSSRSIAFFAGLAAQFLITLFFRDGRDIVLGALRAKFNITQNGGGGT